MEKNNSVGLYRVRLLEKIVAGRLTGPCLVKQVIFGSAKCFVYIPYHISGSDTYYISGSDTYHISGSDTYHNSGSDTYNITGSLPYQCI